MPMHILTVPSTFKAYVEQIFHEGRVFRFDEAGFCGLLGGRKVLFFLSKMHCYRRDRIAWTKKVQPISWGKRLQIGKSHTADLLCN